MFLPALKASTGHTSTQSVYRHRMQASVTAWVMAPSLLLLDHQYRTRQRILPGNLRQRFPGPSRHQRGTITKIAPSASSTPSRFSLLSGSRNAMAPTSVPSTTTPMFIIENTTAG